MRPSGLQREERLPVQRPVCESPRILDCGTNTSSEQHQPSVDARGGNGSTKNNKYKVFGFTGVKLLVKTFATAAAAVGGLIIEELVGRWRIGEVEKSIIQWNTCWFDNPQTCLIIDDLLSVTLSTGIFSTEHSPLTFLCRLGEREVCVHHQMSYWKDDSNCL